MIIAPEVYYEKNIAGKSPKEILEEIKSIKAEIRRLKETEENPTEENIFDRFMDPSPEVRIKCNRLYLQKAIKGLEEIGTEYIPSAEEKRVAEFDDNIKNIIQFSLNIGGYFTGFRTYTVDITDSKTTLAVKHFKNLEQYLVEKNIFLEDLKDLYLGEWENSYYPEELIEDGCQWHIFVKYKNKEFLNYDGDNKYPYNFDNLLDCIRRWLPDEEADKLFKM